MPNKTCSVAIDGKQYNVLKGRSLLSVLIENGILALKNNAVSGRDRFGTCGMGVCFECEIFIHKVGVRRACLVILDTDVIVQTGVFRE